MHSVVVLSGGFDPVHEGHIALFEEAKHKYDYVVVGLNSDEWLTRKKGKPFMCFDTRKIVLESLKYVNEVWSFNDSDNTAMSLLDKARKVFPEATITFGNGGDRSNGSFPELAYCDRRNIKIDDSLGGATKMNSSSSILSDWSNEEKKRDWGEWKVLQKYDGRCKVKELIVLPGKNLSWQKHEHRAELWFVRKGTATLYYSIEHDIPAEKMLIYEHEIAIIPKGEWHSLENETNDTISVVELQYGDLCEESDIIRKSFIRIKKTN